MKDAIAICRWHIAATSANTGGFLYVCRRQTCKQIPLTLSQVTSAPHWGSRAFLSSVLDWPYPDFAVHVDMAHTGLSVVEFRPEGDWCIPRMLTYSNDAHLYADDLPTRYNYRVSY